LLLVRACEPAPAFRPQVELAEYEDRCDPIDPVAEIQAAGVPSVFRGAPFAASALTDIRL